MVLVRFFHSNHNFHHSVVVLSLTVVAKLYCLSACIYSSSCVPNSFSLPVNSEVFKKPSPNSKNSKRKSERLSDSSWWGSTSNPRRPLTTYRESVSVSPNCKWTVCTCSVWLASCRFEEVRLRYERRESRQEDLNIISDLRQVIAEQEKDLACLNEEKRYFQMRLISLESRLEDASADEETFEDAEQHKITELPEPPSYPPNGLPPPAYPSFPAPPTISIPPTIPECDEWFFLTLPNL